MPSIATTKSKTRHRGDPLSPDAGGSKKVKINGVPAWRAKIDFHICKLSDGSKPHIGGMVIESDASSKVFIESFPAVRVGDKITEIGGPANFICEGDKKVKVIII